MIILLSYCVYSNNNNDYVVVINNNSLLSLFLTLFHVTILMRELACRMGGAPLPMPGLPQQTLQGIANAQNAQQQQRLVDQLNAMQLNPGQQGFAQVRPPLSV